MKTRLILFTTLLSISFYSAQVYLQSGFNFGNGFGLTEIPYDDPQLEYPLGMHAEAGVAIKSKWQIGIFYQHAQADKSNYLITNKSEELTSLNQTFGLRPTYKIHQYPNKIASLWVGIPLFFSSQTNNWRTGIYNAYNPNDYSSGVDDASFFSIGIAPSLKISPENRHCYFYFTPTYAFHTLQSSTRHVYIAPTLGETTTLQNDYAKSSFLFNFGFGYLFGQK